MNYRFDLAEWLTRLPLTASYGGYSAETITGPSHICQNEHLRRIMEADFAWGPAVPIDVFVMADGEPRYRHVTKIGGLPYRLASTHWPVGPAGTSLAFLAQINFADSLDLTGPLPGDVLLVFTDNVSDLNYLHFEWQHLGLTDLVSQEGIPESPVAVDPALRLARQKHAEQSQVPLEFSEGYQEQMDMLRGYMAKYGMRETVAKDTVPSAFPEPTNIFAPCYGHICRTTSFPEAILRDQSAQGQRVEQDYLLPRYQATQIGTAPFFIQRDDFEMLPGRLLCTVNSVHPEMHKPYPWINHPAPLLPKGKWTLDREYLMLGDVGCIYISIDDDAKLHWHSSCY